MSDQNTIFSIEARVAVQQGMAAITELRKAIESLPNTIKIGIGSEARAAGKRAGKELVQGAEEEVKRKPLNISINTAKIGEAKKQIKAALRSLEDDPDARLRLTLTGANAEKVIRQLKTQLLELQGVAERVNITGRVNPDSRVLAAARNAKTEQLALEEALRTAVQIRANDELALIKRNKAASDLAAKEKIAQQKQLEAAQRAIEQAQIRQNALGRANIAGLASAEAVLTRIASRVQFLFTAAIAGIGVDFFSKSIEEAAALEGQIRGMEITAARFGQSGTAAFASLTEGMKGFRFQADNAADALNKFYIGGIAPNPAQLERLKGMATGAGVLFGSSPSKMLEDLGTGILRLSPRILDNLGLIVRAKDAYAAYGEQIGKDAKDLTGAEKVLAFFNMALNNAGSDALVAASQIHTPFMTLQEGKATLFDLKIAFGEVIGDGIMPLVTGFNTLDQASERTFAKFTVNTAVTAALTYGLVQLGQALTAIGQKIAATRALAAVQASLGASQYAVTQVAPSFVPGIAASIASNTAKAEALTQQGALSRAQLTTMASTTALTAAVALGVIALQNYNSRMAEVSRGLLDLQADQLKWEAFLSSINLGTPRAAAQIDALKRSLDGLNADTATRASIAKNVESAQNFAKELEAAGRAAGMSEEQLKQFGKAGETAIAAYLTQLREIDTANGSAAISWEDAQRALTGPGGYVDALLAASRELEKYRIQQALTVLDGKTGWDDFLNFLTHALFATADVIAQTFKNLAAAVIGAIGEIYVGIQSIIQSADDYIHGRPFTNHFAQNQANNPWVQYSQGIFNQNGPLMEGYGFGLSTNAADSERKKRQDLQARMDALNNPNGPLAVLPQDVAGMSDEDKRKQQQAAEAWHKELNSSAASIFQNAPSSYSDAIDNACASAAAERLRALGMNLPAGISTTGELAAAVKAAGWKKVKAKDVTGVSVLFSKDKTDTTKGGGPNGMPDHAMLGLGAPEGNRISYIDQSGKPESAGLNYFDYAYVPASDSQLAALLANSPALGQMDPLLGELTKMLAESKNAAAALENYSALVKELPPVIGNQLEEAARHEHLQQQANQYEELIKKGLLAYKDKITDPTLLAEIDTLKEAFQAAKISDSLHKMLEAMDEAGKNVREFATKLKDAQLSDQLSAIDYGTRLAQARQPDANKDSVLGAHGLIAQAEALQAAAVGVEPGSVEARNLRDQSRAVLISLEETLTGMQAFATSEGKKQIEALRAGFVADFEAQTNALAPDVRTAEQFAREQNTTGWQLNTAAVTASTSNLYTFVSALGAAAGALSTLIGAIRNAAAAAGAAASAAAAKVAGIGAAQAAAFFPSAAPGSSIAGGNNYAALGGNTGGLGEVNFGNSGGGSAGTYRIRNPKFDPG